MCAKRRTIIHLDIIKGVVFGNDQDRLQKNIMDNVYDEEIISEAWDYEKKPILKSFRKNYRD